MGVLSFRFKKLQGDIGEPTSGEVKITSSLPKVKKVEEREINVGNSKQKVLAVDFEYSVGYEPTKAKISAEGELLYTHERQKDILNKWKKKEKLDEEVALPLMNYIFKRCSIAAIKIADDLQLLPPVKLPEFVKRDQKQEA